MPEIFSKLSSNIAGEHSRSGSEFNTNGSQNRHFTEKSPLNESFAGIVVSFTVYKLLSELTKPFTQLEAYRANLIDANGNFTKPESSLTSRDKQILSPFARMVIGIKRLIASSGSSKLKAEYSYIQTAARAMAFECVELGGDADLFLEELQKSIDVLCEDGEAGNCACGNIGGGPQVGTPNPALAGYDPVMSMGETKMLKRKRRDVLKDVILKP